jgi:hypothetical protein
MSYDLGTARGKITLEYDGGREADKADDDIERIRRSSEKADNDLKKFGKTLGKVFSVLGKATAAVGLTVALAQGAVQAAALGVQLLGIIPSLVQIGSLIAAVPAALLAAGVAAGVLAAAFSGVGDSIKAAFSGDLEKFNEALEKLSPQAREFAQGIRAVVPALKAVQQGIQDAFFASNLQDFLPRIVAGFRELAPQLNQVAAQFGGMARQVLQFATSRESLNLVSGAVGLLQRGLIALTPTIEPILNGLRDVGRVGLEFLGPMVDNVTQLGIRFGDWLSQVANGGQLLGWMEGAADTLSTLASIAKNFGGAFSGIFQIAEQTGGGLLNVINQIATALNNFVNSAEGQEVIAGLFTAIMEVARQLTPVFTELVKVVGGALGPALLRLAQEAGPILLQVVERLGPALTPLAEALVDVLIAVLPLLPAIAQIASVLATVLAGALTNVVAALGPFIEMWSGALLAAWETIAPLAQQLGATLLPAMAEAGLALAEALAPLAPVLVELAQTIVSSLLPHLPELAALFRDEIVPALVQLAEVIAEEGVAALRQFIPLIPILVDLMVLLVPLFAQWVGFILRVAAAMVQLMGFIRGLPALLIGLAVALVQLIGQGLSAAWNAIVNFGTQVFGFFAALPGRIGAFLAALPGVLLDLFTRAINGALFAIGFGIGLIIAQVTKMPVAIGKALAALPGILLNLFQRAWSAVTNLVTTGIARVVGFFQALPGRIRSAVSGLLGVLRTAGSQAINGMQTAITQGITKVLNAARALPGRIRSAIGNLAGLLRSAGADLIQGLINGMQSLIGRAVDIARNAANKIKEGIKSALRIGSPSRIMIQFGEWTVEGLIVGMRNLFGLLGKTAEAMASTAIAPTATGATNTTPLITVNGAPGPDNRRDDGDERPPYFGPYVIQVGDKALVEMVVDAVSGVPQVVSRTAKEGERQLAWANPGR